MATRDARAPWIRPIFVGFAVPALVAACQLVDPPGDLHDAKDAAAEASPGSPDSGNPGEPTDAGDATVTLDGASEGPQCAGDSSLLCDDFNRTTAIPTPNDTHWQQAVCDPVDGAALFLAADQLVVGYPHSMGAVQSCYLESSPQHPTSQAYDVAFETIGAAGMLNGTGEVALFDLSLTYLVDGGAAGQLVQQDFQLRALGQGSAQLVELLAYSGGDGGDGSDAGGLLLVRLLDSVDSNHSLTMGTCNVVLHLDPRVPAASTASVTCLVDGGAVSLPGVTVSLPGVTDGSAPGASDPAASLRVLLGYQADGGTHPFDRTIVYDNLVVNPAD